MHGFAGWRYLGFVRLGIQIHLAFLVLNLKKLVKLLTGVSLRGEARGYAWLTNKGELYSKTE